MLIKATLVDVITTVDFAVSFMTFIQIVNGLYTKSELLL